MEKVATVTLSNKTHPVLSSTPINTTTTPTKSFPPPPHLHHSFPSSTTTTTTSSAPLPCLYPTLPSTTSTTATTTPTITLFPPPPPPPPASLTSPSPGRSNSKYKIVHNMRGRVFSQVLNRSMDPRTYEQQQPLIAQLPQLPLLPQQIITSGTRKDCIRLRGLPFEAQVEHILEFLGELAKSIVYQGVHMVYNAHGQPSGEAFIQMDSEHSAFLASQQRHHRYMVFGKKQRYIEVFQCSGEDMNMVLTGGLPAQRPIVSPGGTVLAPPFGAFPLGPAPPVLNAVGAVTPRLPAYPGVAYPTMFYWPYPSPPVSPSSPYYGSPPHLATPATPPHHTIVAPECLAIQANGDTTRHNGEVVATM